MYKVSISTNICYFYHLECIQIICTLKLVTQLYLTLAMLTVIFRVCKVSGTSYHHSSYLIEITLGYITGAGPLAIALQLL